MSSAKIKEGKLFGPAVVHKTELVVLKRPGGGGVHFGRPPLIIIYSKQLILKELWEIMRKSLTVPALVRMKVLVQTPPV